MTGPANSIHEFFKIDRFNALRPYQFGQVRRLTVEDVYPGHRTCTVELVLLTDRLRTEPRLELRFIDAVEVKIGRLDVADGVRLQIRDIADRQLEGIRFEAFDAESGLISLQCADFDFHLIGRSHDVVK